MKSKDPYSVASSDAVSGNSPVTPVCPAPSKHNPSPPPSEREVKTRERRKFEIKSSHLPRRVDYWTFSVTCDVFSVRSTSDPTIPYISRSMNSPHFNT